MRIRVIFLFFLSGFFFKSLAQNYPWERPLHMAWSSDGINFGQPVLFQDSSGVPSAVKWKGDTLISAFQWFRAPVGSPSWDRVAVKFSYDNGLTWTPPEPIVINGMPMNYQRPFDPALAVINRDSIRIYFSSSDGMPNGGLDSTVNTYSAVSTDGVQYSFEPGARVDEVSNRVIDPSVIWFHHAWHYLSPAGSPAQGAYHYVSPDGINFMKVQNIISDSMHNWTGNYVVIDTAELRFYGTGNNALWFNSSANGGVWNGYVNTNLQGGDPTVVRTAPNAYLIIYTGAPYSLNVPSVSSMQGWTIYPNPNEGTVHIRAGSELIGADITLTNSTGSILKREKISLDDTVFDIHDLPPGIYYVCSSSKHLKPVKLIRD